MEKEHLSIEEVKYANKLRSLSKELDEWEPFANPIVRTQAEFLDKCDEFCETFKEFSKINPAQAFAFGTEYATYIPAFFTNAGYYQDSDEFASLVELCRGKYAQTMKDKNAELWEQMRQHPLYRFSFETVHDVNEMGVALLSDPDDEMPDRTVIRKLDAETMAGSKGAYVQQMKRLDRKEKSISKEFASAEAALLGVEEEYRQARQTGEPEYEPTNRLAGRTYEIERIVRLKKVDLERSIYDYARILYLRDKPEQTQEYISDPEHAFATERRPPHSRLAAMLAVDGLELEPMDATDKWGYEQAKQQLMVNSVLIKKIESGKVKMGPKALLSLYATNAKIMMDTIDMVPEYETRHGQRLYYDGRPQKTLPLKTAYEIGLDSIERYPLMLTAYQKYRESKIVADWMDSIHEKAWQAAEKDRLARQEREDHIRSGKTVKSRMKMKPKENLVFRRDILENLYKKGLREQVSEGQMYSPRFSKVEPNKELVRLIYNGHSPKEIELDATEEENATPEYEPDGFEL